MKKDIMIDGIKYVPEGSEATLRSCCAAAGSTANRFQITINAPGGEPYAVAWAAESSPRTARL